jgi:hypothetical protein
MPDYLDSHLKAPRARPLRQDANEQDGQLRPMLELLRLKPITFRRT